MVCRRNADECDCLTILKEAEQHVGAASAFPGKMETARVRGIPAIPRRSPRTPLPPVPTVCGEHSFRKMAK